MAPSETIEVEIKSKIGRSLSDVWFCSDSSLSYEAPEGPIELDDLGTARILIRNMTDEFLELPVDSCVGTVRPCDSDELLVSEALSDFHCIDVGSDSHFVSSADHVAINVSMEDQKDRVRVNEARATNKPKARSRDNPVLSVVRLSLIHI